MKESANRRQYPRIAQLRGWQGTAVVRVRMDFVHDKIMSLELVESTGYEVLDRQAVENAKIFIYPEKIGKLTDKRNGSFDLSFGFHLN